MINILLNDESITLTESCSIKEFLAKQNHIGDCFAVALNNQVIRREQYESTLVKNGDALDIILPMQGG